MSLIFEHGAGRCPHCRRHVGFVVNERLVVYPEFADVGHSDFESIKAKREPLPAPGTREIITLGCPACEDRVIVMDAWEDCGAGTQLVARSMIHPAAASRELPSATPLEVRSLFDEASVCESAGALRAAGVLYRAATEEMVKDQGGTGKDLYAKIQSLETKVDEDLLTGLHESRVVGNDSIHHGVEYAADEIGDLADLLQEAALVLYEQPAQNARMRQARLARHTAARGGSRSS